MGIKNVKIKNIFIDHYKYLGKYENSLKIYDPPPRSLILSPFNLIFDAIDRLFVVSFEDDPIYYRVELQIFHKLDTDYPLVILYRKDNMVDVYYTNEVVISNRKKMLTDLFVNASFNQLEEIEFTFQFDDTGLNAFLLLEDKLEQEIELKIKENRPGRELASILAPMSATSKEPEYFPIVFLNKFGMVIKRNTEISVKIHGVARNTTEMPVQINGRDVYTAHYSLQTIISNWNNVFTGSIDPIIINAPSLKISDNNIDFVLKNNSGYYEINKISGRNEEDHTISFEFSPAVPNLFSLRSKTKIKGRFSCIIDEKKGIFAGEYYLARTRDIIEFSITPTKGWQPFPGKLWLKNYKWTSSIQIQDIEDIKISSNWRRIIG
ncbi:MAG: hypothetical protein HWN79_00295 [Candidatus Lokiarchaeota archaeon]|nr:hypothetical protein [Candidatus Lokiarchaeota archaeon]